MQHLDYVFVFKDVDAQEGSYLLFLELEGVDQISRVASCLLVEDSDLNQAHQAVVCLPLRMLHVDTDPLLLAHVLHGLNQVVLSGHHDDLASPIVFLQGSLLQ